MLNSICVQPKETVICDMLISKFILQIQKRSKEILTLYNDEERILKSENEVFSGQKLASKQFVVQ